MNSGSVQRKTLDSAGIILKALGGLYTVLLDGGETAVCRPRGRLRADGVKPVPGDCVYIGGDSRIERIAPRESLLARPAVANMNALALVLSQAPPRGDPFLADKLAASAAYHGLDVLIICNKADLARGAFWEARYAKTGYLFFQVSAVTGEGLEALRTGLAHRRVILAGYSGVGKSSLLNALYPRAALPTGEIGERTHLGRHTTRHVELIRLTENCLAADTPGFSVFDANELKHLTRDGLARLFPEMAGLLGQCKYRDCRHETDEGCAVLEAVARGDFDAGRHASFFKMAAELKKEYEI